MRSARPTALLMAFESYGDEIAELRGRLRQAEATRDWWRELCQVAMNQLHQYEQRARRHRDQVDRLVEENRRLRALIVDSPGKAA